MALPDLAIPFGLRQVKLTPYKDDGTLDESSAVMLPAARTFSFSEEEDYEQLEGDDRIVASHGAGPTVSWELESGGISLAAYRILAGGTITDTGSAGTETRSYVKKTTDSRPYFQVSGRAISDNGGDFHAIVHRCKADDSLEGEMAHGEFLLTNASGAGYGDPEDSDKLYEFIHNAEETPLSI